MKWVSCIIPVLFLALFLYAVIRRIRLYDCFTDGVKEAVPLVLSVFPYLAAMLILSALFEKSGLAAMVTHALTPCFRLLGIPPEISPLVLIKPFSGSGSTAILSELYAAYGPDSYIGRCASAAYGSSETVFYILAVYFAGQTHRRLFFPVLCALFANLLGVVAACLLCRVL